MTKSLKNVKNEKCTLKDLIYGEKTENNRKFEILEQLDKMMEFKTSHPKLFEAYILLKNRDKLPNKTLNRVKKIIR